MRCQISDNDFHKSGNACVQLGHAKNRLKKPKQSFVFEFSARNNFLVRFLVRFVVGFVCGDQQLLVIGKILFPGFASKF